MGMRRKFYIDPEVQFPLIVALIFLVTAQGMFVGWGFAKALALARDWQRPDQASEFFKVLALTLLPLVAVNFAIGTWLSHKIVGPLTRVRQAMSEIARGNLEVDVTVRRGDLLHAYVGEMNRMIQTMRRLIYRDHGHAAEVDQILSDCRRWLADRQDLPAAARDELGARLEAAKSRLSIINAHFLKGRIEARPPERPS